MKDSLRHPKNPERICWGCSRYCPANDLGCRMDRVSHPQELLGEDWEAPPPSPFIVLDPAHPLSERRAG